MTITINNKDYRLKYTIRALFIFEQISGKPFEIKSTLDNSLFFYSMILANNPDTPLEWDEFIDALDNDYTLLGQLNSIITDSQNKNHLFLESEDQDGQKKS